MPRKMSFVLFAVVVLLALALPAWAGGFAVVTLDELPTNVVAGQPLAIGFMVRQHGVSPMTGIIPTLIARHPDTGETLRATALPEGARGHYAATITFPSSGTWRWVINDGFATSDALGFQGQPMPDLMVMETGAVTSVPTRQPASLPMALGFVGVVGAIGGLIALVRTRNGWAAAAMLIAAMIAGLGFVSAGNSPSQSVALAAPDSSPAETGQALFLAKGCVICHAHAAVTEARRSFAEFSIGPNLTTLSANPDFLRQWLKDPSAVKPGTAMPTLGLSDSEIEALIAFLKAGE